ncbi:MAG: MBL fold metallo-hydrolase [Hyphomicrobiales bacterium]|nr:MBL fold metallo-hydrolase [Hyphomicrobiales bacterium]MCP5371153.1 MBL fold metallo-hydrolase [Hyphomicrobiales bacterium]
MTAPDRPDHHAPGGGFRNPPGGPGRVRSLREMLPFILRFLLSDRMPPVPDGHVLPRDEVMAGLAAAGNPGVTWLGHAAFIVRLGGKVVLTDPFLGEKASPAFANIRRYVPAALGPDEVPRADAIVVSHNHYDHLDAVAIAAYPHKDTTQVVVPLGLGRFFTRRGYARVAELDWWQAWEGDGLRVTVLPAVHASGRTPFDRNRTLWASMAIEAGGERVWFAGDTAAGPVFDEIGARMGPFDLALVPIGAYEPRQIMRAVHATPEEAVAIARAVGARTAVAMHWGTIMLTPEDPFEAPGRFHRAAADQGYGVDNAWVLKIGESRAFPAGAEGRS